MAADERSGHVSFSTSPLLGSQNQQDTLNKYGAISSVAEIEGLLDPREHALHTTAKEEAKLLLKNSIPLCITYLLQYSFSLVTIFTVGHLGTNELGAVSLATMTANITGYAVFEGLASSLDTLCAQAYGSGRKEQVGLHFQRMVLLMLLATVPIGALWLNSGAILAAIVPEKDIAYIAGRYLRVLLLSTPGYALFEAGKRYMQAQGIFNASLYVLLVAFPLNIVFNYVLVFVLQWGLQGAVLATVLSNSCLPLGLLLYIHFFRREALACWPGLSHGLVLRNWGPMLRLSVPGIIMIEAEWLAFDILTFSSSYLSTAHLAAQSICMTSCIVMFHIPFSVAVAASTRLGNLIGAGALPAARLAARTYVLIVATLGLLDASLFFSMASLLPRFFSSDPRVIAIAAECMPVLAVFQIFDASTNLVNGILRGLGAQRVGGWVNLVVYYGIAVPVALGLCFRVGWELKGLWIGCVLGSALITCVAGTWCWRSDWGKAAERARARACGEVDGEREVVERVG